MLQANVNAVYVVVAREFIKFVRERGRLVSTLARPLLWLFLVGGGMSRLVTTDMGIPYTQFLFPGIIGFEFVVRPGPPPALIVRDAQHEYVFASDEKRPAIP